MVTRRPHARHIERGSAHRKARSYTTSNTAGWNLKKSAFTTASENGPATLSAACSAASEKSIAVTTCPSSAKWRSSCAEPQPGISTRIRPRGVASQVFRSGGTPPKSHGVMPALKRSSQKRGLEQSDAKQDQRGHQHDEQRNQQIVAPRVLGGEPLDGQAQRAEAVLGERAVQEARQLRQRVRPVRRLLAQRAQHAAPADLLAHPALEKRCRRGPQVEVRIELASQAFDVEQGLLQHDELRLDLDVEAARGLEQAQ